MIVRRKQLGFTLIELLIAMAIGLFVVAAVITMYVSMSGSNIDYLKSIRLNHELRSTMGLMVRDIRRAGHSQSTASVVASGASSVNPFSTSTGTVLTVTGTSTVAFSYDADGDATVDTYGYRFNTTDGTVEYCAASTVCTVGSTWQQLTDEELIEITALTFVPASTVVGFLATRQVVISLTGRLRSDTDFTKTITETVKVRNDHVTSW